MLHTIFLAIYYLINTAAEMFVGILTIKVVLEDWCDGYIIKKYIFTLTFLTGFIIILCGAYNLAKFFLTIGIK